MEKHVVLKSLGQETENFLHTLKVGSRATVIGLYGELGSGKTTFVQHIAKALSVEQPVTSPTFVIERVYRLPPELSTNENEYKTNAFAKNSIKFGKHSSGFAYLIHIDAYRLESSDELLKLGFAELLKNPKNIIFIEWADRVGDILPDNTTKIYFEVAGEKERKISVNEK